MMLCLAREYHRFVLQIVTARPLRQPVPPMSHACNVHVAASRGVIYAKTKRNAA